MEFVSRKQNNRAMLYRRPRLQVQQRQQATPSKVAKKTVDAVKHSAVATPNVPAVKKHHHTAKSDIARYKVETKKTAPPAKSVHTARPETSRRTHHAVIGKVGMKADTLQRAVEVQASSRSTKKRSRFANLLQGIAVLFVVAGVAVVVQGFMANKAVETQVKALQHETEKGTSSTVLPTDKKPKDKNFVANHKVAPLVPRLISIPNIKVNARIVPMGADKEGAMESPKTSYDAGWYTASSRPGEMGAMVVDGHVLGDGGPGVFGKLKTLQAGNVITIERGDGKKFTYVVQKTETMPTDKVDMGKLLVSANTNKPGLNIITCAGKFDPKKIAFDSRTVVYAVQQ